MGPSAERGPIPCHRPPRNASFSWTLRCLLLSYSGQMQLLSFLYFFNIGREGNVAVLRHAVTLWAKWESLEKSKSVTLNDDISAFVAEGSVCVFLLAPVKKAFGVLSLNIFTLLFLLYSWYSWIKYVQLLSFGCFSTVWKLDEAKNMD